MSDNRKDLAREDIERLIAKLDAELTRRGQKAILYVVGGANVAMAIDNSRTTTDIHVVVKKGFDIVFDAARQVARDEPGLGADWINADFTGGSPDGGISWQWMDNRDDDEPATSFAGDSLRVELASPHMVLALKTLAQRPQDMDDIYLLMRLTGISTAEQIGRNLARFTGRRIFDAQGQPGMPLQIDPTFRRILDGAPPDLRPATAARERPRLLERLRGWLSSERDTTAEGAQRKAARCGVVSVTLRGGVEVGRSQPCSKRAGHHGRHRFSGRRSGR